jgi:hypothetical protein
MSSRYRGQLASSVKELNAVIRILLTIIALDVELRPLKALERIALFSEEERTELRRELGSTGPTVIRKYYDGLPLGNNSPVYRFRLLLSLCSHWPSFPLLLNPILLPRSQSIHLQHARLTSPHTRLFGFFAGFRVVMLARNCC